MWHRFHVLVGTVGYSFTIDSVWAYTLVETPEYNCHGFQPRPITVTGYERPPILHRAEKGPSAGVGRPHLCRY